MIFLKRIARMSALSLSLIVGACGQRDAQDPKSLPGKNLFVEQRCVLCHGDDLNGSAMGPALRGVRAHLTREMMIEYLRNPAAYAAKDRRLAEQGARYPQMMPGFGSLERTQLEQLADYVLSFDK